MELPCPSEPLDLELPAADRLGAYRLLRVIGRGAMGAVYLAVRDDHQFRQQVAVKVVRRGMDTDELLSRFRSERQILANLDHPYVARLIDAGATSDGRPFFVMEYVDGDPVDRYCSRRKLDVEARCRLFLKICEAVAYAHRNLIVHRDLKPGNILVTADGEPKLLDFGVAKLLIAEEGSGATRFAARIFTPAYASPEQVRGMPAATTADVYSLGAVLFEMLTGERSLAADPSAPDEEIERAICETETRRPSSVSHGLNADLDNIVLMAMRKDPALRYQSVADLAADVERHLARKPVVARPVSAWYGARKFLRRNWVAAASAALVVASLMAGTAIALRETAEARRERARAESQARQADSARAAEAAARAFADSERAEAGRQRAQAEERLNDMIAMANRAFFGVHDRIASLPGGTAARRELVKTTLEYLQNVEKSNGLDRRMRIVLSTGYEKVGMVQGDPYGPSLQDFRGAEVSLRKAEELLRPVYLASPNDAVVLLRWIEIQTGLADNDFQSRLVEGAAPRLLNVLPLTRRLAALLPLDLNAAQQEAQIEGKLAVVYRSGKGVDTVVHSTRQTALLRGLVRRFPQDLGLETSLGEALASLALAISRQGEWEKAAEYYRESIGMREKLAATTPDTPGLRRNLMVAYGNYAVLLGIPWTANLGRFDEARLYCGKAVAIARDMVKADPQNATARFDLGMSLSRLGMVPPPPDGVLESLGYLRESVGILEELQHANPQAPAMRTGLSLVLEYVGKRLESLHQPDEAAARYRQALAEVEPLLSTAGTLAALPVISERDALALLAAAAGDRDQALAYAKSAVECADKFYATPAVTESQTAYRAQAYFKLALVYQAREEWKAAADALAVARGLWAPLRNPDVVKLHRADSAAADALAPEFARRLAQQP